MDLSGTWRATPASEELRRTFHEPDLDDRGWQPIAVPGHWAHVPGMASERAVLHRTRFNAAVPDDERRRWLRFDGISQQGDVWLNGGYVGDTDGYFVPHVFEVTDLMADREAHTLAVDVSCPRFGNPDERTNLMGAILDPELSGAAGMNPGGIWQGVSLLESGPSAIKYFRAICVDANTARARLALRCVIDHPEGGMVTLRTTVADHTHELRHPAAAGENRVEWTIDVPEPELWWPHALGNQPLHQLRCELDVDGEVYDHRERRIGLRSIRMNKWTLQVNGTRLFTKGINHLPTRPRLGDASPIEVIADIRAVRDAGLDLVRLVAHVARPEVYEAADELGVLIWQDLPIRGVMARGVRGQAVRQAREAVDLLGHHPSVAVWCAHDEPHRQPTVRVATPPVVGQQRPSWNRAVLDRSIRRVLQRTDGSRPVINHTDVPPHLPQLDGTTSHLWFGWHDRTAADLGPALARVPRMGRFVTAFGAASVSPTLPELSSPRWPALNWEAIAAAVGGPADSLHHLVPPAAVADGQTWARMTQEAQAELIRTTIETLRRLKYRPTAGFCLHYLADPSSAGGFGVLDHERRAKPAWTALIDACRPVIIVADPLPPVLRAGTPQSVAIHVVSDLREPLTGAEIRATVTFPDGQTHGSRWGGDVAADTCEFIAELDFTPPTTPGEIRLDLELITDDLAIANTYRTSVG
jgi:beta-mannosidase